MAQASRLATDVAVALGDPAVRTAVRDALRASLVDGHKVELAQFLRSPGGRVMLDAIASRGHETAEQAMTRIGLLPALDFHMPFGEHRRTWKASDDAPVLVTLSASRGLWVGARSSGDRIAPAERVAVLTRPFFMLEPAEPKGLRVNPQPDVPGEVIEDAGDGQHSASFVYTDAQGRKTTYDLARHPELAPRRQTSSGDATLLNQYILYMCDNQVYGTNCAGDVLEIRFNATYYNASGQFVGSGEYRASVNPGVWQTPNYPIIAQRLLENSAERMSLTAVEEDRNDWFGTNADDNCGTQTISSSGNGQNLYFPSTNDCFWSGGGSYPNPVIAKLTWTPKTTVACTATTYSDGQKTISPYVWNGSGFQSTCGNGYQSTVRISLNSPASSVTVTAYDPDYSENWMIAYNAAGQEVSRVRFDPDYVPGTLTTSTKTVTGTGIVRVDLVPDPADWVYYNGVQAY